MSATTMVARPSAATSKVWKTRFISRPSSTPASTSSGATNSATWVLELRPGVRRAVDAVEQRGEDQPHHRQGEHRGAHPGIGAIEADDRMPAAAGDEREPQNEQQITQDAAGDRRLDQIHQPGPERD